MSNLRELNLKISYGPTNDRLREFFIPAMLSVAASDFTNFAVTIAADRDLSIAV